ncbi:MAG TPA: 16S rRNA (guanine(527)-N(7))-methyltransferase RsmG [Dehalococcoidia bacterium]|nr:16S rRNA (guanine(527)-N(7))-methyltransferase RsmG [Dehalococcoidia bacterium]
MVNVLVEGAGGRGIRLSEAQVAQFARYLSLLMERSAQVNLIGRAPAEVVVQRHFVESLALGAALREREIMRPDATVLDLGAGAGLPGIPLKIAWPGLRLTMVDATAKKTAFMREAVAALGLGDVRVVTGRAETLGHDAELRGQFDLVLARALAPLAVLLELALPFARVRGHVVSPKGSRAAEELEAAQHALEVLGARARTLPFDVAGPPQTLIVVAKERETAGEYPRRDGVPSQAPL